MSNKIIESKLEKQKSLQIATFAAGCFWGVEEAFRQVKGGGSCYYNPVQEVKN